MLIINLIMNFFVHRKKEIDSISSRIENGLRNQINLRILNRRSNKCATFVVTFLCLNKKKMDKKYIISSSSIGINYLKI